MPKSERWDNSESIRGSFERRDKDFDATVAEREVNFWGRTSESLSEKVGDR